MTLKNSRQSFRKELTTRYPAPIVIVSKKIQKMPRKPELQHQYVCMLFNHQGDMMPGLQSLQLFLIIDLPKLEDLHHEPPAFPNCTTWAVPHPIHKDYYSTGGRINYIKIEATAYKELNESISST